jgi:CRP/FNR family transcriptional regulator, cyclic AMP receptor protein
VETRLASDTNVHGFLRLLNPAECAAIVELGTRRRFARGAVLMFENEPGDRVTVLLEGRVKATRLGEDGRETLLSIREPGDILGELSVVEDLPRIASITALEPVEAVIIAASRFRSHLEHTPRVAVVLLGVVTRRLRDATVKRSQFATSDTLARLAARLLELGERFGEASDNGLVVESPLSQEELAAWTGASRAGVAQALHTLRDLGWIHTDRRRITICNESALRARASPQPQLNS